MAAVVSLGQTAQYTPCSNLIQEQRDARQVLVYKGPIFGRGGKKLI